MRVGVICEGPTDFIAIKHFFGAALRNDGCDVLFIGLQPEMDNTQRVGGWSNVECWLRKNPVSYRVRRFFGGGLFAYDLDSKRCDVFLIQIDGDNLDDCGFRTFMETKYQLAIHDNIVDSVDRCQKIIDVLDTWCDVGCCTNADQEKHINAPAIESTEAWCVATFSNTSQNVENLRGQQLVDAFMKVLHKSESRPNQRFSGIDKSVPRREKFCSNNISGVSRISTQCTSFNNALENLRKQIAAQGT